MKAVQKFQELVKKFFRLESFDLDFGDYRILSYKKDRIENFIERLKDKLKKPLLSMIRD